MTNIFSGQQDQNNVDDAKDSVGGSFTLESNTYNMIIEMAYADKSSGGASCLHLHLNDGNGNLHKEDIYTSSGDAKGNKITYTDKNGKEQYLPGYNVGSAITALAGDCELAALEMEEKVIKLYDYDAKKELPKKVMAITSLIDKPIILGIVKQKEDKQIKGADNRYVPSGDTRTINVIDAVFRASDGLTKAEAKAGATEAKFKQQWLDKWKGQERDRSTGKASSVKPGAPATTESTTSLFG